ncbi:uncharacterized protein VTP21DRAFT_6989 [Calcarisporiella thermophila]|uniref:uncharacterized protein n=1 Tax=Calcarisporiella thermophila TaxID=911321 RepID=UPI003743CDA1
MGGSNCENENASTIQHSAAASIEKQKINIPIWMLTGLVACVAVVMVFFTVDLYEKELKFSDYDFSPLPPASLPSLGPLIPLYHQDPPPAEPNPKHWQHRANQVAAAFQHAWHGYARDAFGKDEYHPLSRNGSNWTPNGIGLTIIDALDTMLLMGLRTEYEQCRNWIAKSLTFDQNGSVNVFETTIRVLGGLLSAFHLSGGDSLYLKRAQELGDKLLAAFDTPSGIPWANVRLDVPSGVRPQAYRGASSTAEATTVQLELRYLSHLTGDRRYWDAAERVMQHMESLPGKIDGLVPIFLHPITGNFMGQEIRLGSRGDSYYEYLLKQYVQTAGTEPVYRQMYDEAMRGVKKHLIGFSGPSALLYIGEMPYARTHPNYLRPKMDHLVCFMGGNLALGASGGYPLSAINTTLADRNDLRVAEELTRTCFEMYNRTRTGLAPEIVYFDVDENAISDMLMKPRDQHYLLRPETVESLFILWRVTEDEKYREWAWKIFQSIENHARLHAGGYTNIESINHIPAPRLDKMETFFLSETLKYLYLTFLPTDVIPLNRYVFNTEAHPLPIFHPRWNTSLEWEKSRQAWI